MNQTLRRLRQLSVRCGRGIVQSSFSVAITVAWIPGAMATTVPDPDVGYRLGASDSSAAPSPTSPTVCGLYYPRLDYQVIDASGNVVPFQDYCQRQQRQDKPDADRFWTAFRVAASSEALATAEELGRSEVMAYSTAICPFLEQGGSLPELRQIQSDRNLPADFEVAVTIAAIHTYCPTYRSEIGR